MENLFYKLHRFFKGQFHLAVLDMDTAKRWIITHRLFHIAYLKAENAQGKHILIQPIIQSSFLMADDISVQLLRLHHQFNNGSWKPGRLVVETSPGNYQVWIHSSRPLEIIEKRYWLKKMKSDPGADPHNRWGRCPGFRNRKHKYCNGSGKYPLARLIWIDWRRQANIPMPKMPEKKTHLRAFPLYPWRGECVLLLTSTGTIITVVMHLPLISPMLWPCSEEALVKTLSEQCSWNRGTTGKIITVSQKERLI